MKYDSRMKYNMVHFQATEMADHILESSKQGISTIVDFRRNQACLIVHLLGERKMP